MRLNDNMKGAALMTGCVFAYVASFHNLFNSQTSLSKRITFKLNRDVALNELC